MRRHSKFFGIKLLNRFALITFLGCISLFSVGFSSWAFVKQTTMGEDVNVNVSDVVSIDAFSISNISMFTLGPDGLVEDDEIVSSSKIVVNFVINNSSAYDKSNSGVLTFYVVLSCNVSSFLSTYVGVTPAVTNSTNISTEPSEGLLTSSITYEITNSGTSSVSIEYTITDDGTIKSFYTNKPLFGFKVKVN